MPTYDVSCIGSRKSSNKQMSHLIGKIAADLEPKGGVIRRVEHYGMRPLAYPITKRSVKHEVGRYFRLFIQTSPGGLKDTLSTLRVHEDIVRVKPFKLKSSETFVDEKLSFKHKPKLSEAHYDALRRTTNINYYIARTLLMQNKITPEEIKALGTTAVQLEPYFRSREEQLAKSVFLEDPSKIRENALRQQQQEYSDDSDFSLNFDDDDEHVGFSDDDNVKHKNAGAGYARGARTDFDNDDFELDASAFNTIDELPDEDEGESYDFSSKTNKKDF